MRRLGMLLVLACIPGAAIAQSGPMSCADQAALVMRAVEARSDGDSLETTRDSLRAELPGDAADLLTQWIYSLDEAQLTPAVGEAWETQCEAL